MIVACKALMKTFTVNPPWYCGQHTQHLSAKSAVSLLLGGKEGINAIQTIYCPKCWSISICLQHQAAVTGFPLTYTWKRLSLQDSLNCANLHWLS